MFLAAVEHNNVLRSQVSLNQAHHCHTHRLSIHILVLTFMSPSGDYGVNIAALKYVISAIPVSSISIFSRHNVFRTTFAFPLNQFRVWSSQEHHSLLSSPNLAKPTAVVAIVRMVHLA